MKLPLRLVCLFALLNSNQISGGPPPPPVNIYVIQDVPGIACHWAKLFHIENFYRDVNEKFLKAQIARWGNEKFALPHTSPVPYILPIKKFYTKDLDRPEIKKNELVIGCPVHVNGLESHWTVNIPELRLVNIQIDLTKRNTGFTPPISASDPSSRYLLNMFNPTWFEGKNKGTIHVASSPAPGGVFDCDKEQQKIIDDLLTYNSIPEWEYENPGVPFPFEFPSKKLNTLDPADTSKIKPQEYLLVCRRKDEMATVLNIRFNKRVEEVRLDGKAKYTANLYPTATFEIHIFDLDNALRRSIALHEAATRLLQLRNSLH